MVLKVAPKISENDKPLKPNKDTHKIQTGKSGGRVRSEHLN